MGFLHKFQHADYKMIFILMTIVSVCVLANVGWVILAIRNYLNYNLNLYIQIPLDITASLIFKYIASLSLSLSLRRTMKAICVLQCISLHADALSMNIQLFCVSRHFSNGKG